jgi:hypothetical protein
MGDDTNAFLDEELLHNKRYFVPLPLQNLQVQANGL